MFSQAKGYSTGRIRFAYIRAQNRPLSQSQRRPVVPSIAHLSTFIQSAKKSQTQRHLLKWPQGSPQEQSDRFVQPLPPEPKETSPTLLLYKLERGASHKLRRRKVQEEQIFLSEIADQTASVVANKECFKRQQEKELLQSRRRNYVMRRLQFQNFLRAQEISRTTPLIPSEDPKEVEYQNQKIKSQSLKVRIINHSCGNLNSKKINRKCIFSVLEGDQSHI